MKLTVAKVEELAAKLRDMPAVQDKERPVSKAETVRMLSKEIQDLQKRGYSLEQIAELLGGEGLAISSATLRSYLRRISATEKRPRTKRTPPKAASSSGSDTRPPPATETNVAKGTFKPRPDTEEI